MSLRWSPIGNVGKLCPECLCKVAGFDQKQTPTALIRFSEGREVKENRCKKCHAWSISPIPAFEVGMYGD